MSDHPKSRLIDRKQLMVYVLDCDHGVKVGITQVGIAARVADLERGSGLNITITRTFPMPDAATARTVEKAAHWALRDTRTVGEWFHCHPFEAVDAIAAALRPGGMVAYHRASYGLPPLAEDAA